MISPGTRLGPYEVVSKIGAGGMGEVWRATDTRLDRTVAVKILPTEFAQNAQVKIRFEREAKTISQLEHPYICRLYDVGETSVSADAVTGASVPPISYLVMELLDGESLAERLARGPLPVDGVLRYGIHIAEALEKAHRAGIVHRDLKPANVMLTKSGAKLLDFGLAKSGGIVNTAGVSPSALTVSATQHKPLTQEGTIVGTFQYMSPEQLEGLDSDPRSDIFALGAVLYEMATGRRAFEGKTRTSLIAAIVGSQPVPISQLQPLTPPALEHVVQRCLQKDPADRWQSANDVAEELKWIARAGSQAGVAAPVAARRKSRERFAWLLHLATALAAIGLTWGAIELRREPPRVVQSTIVAPEKAQFAFQLGAMSLSPDGTRIAFVATSANEPPRLWVRPLSSRSAQPLGATEGANHPFWSPDSRYIGFFADGRLKKIDASGGPAQTLAVAPAGRGGSWSPEGVIVFSPAMSSALVAVPDSGGTPRPVTQLDEAKGDRRHRLPFFLPDGRRFLYLVDRRVRAAGTAFVVSVASLDGDVHRDLTDTESHAVFAAGHLLYVRDGSLVAQRLDTDSLTLDASVKPVVDGVQSNNRFESILSVSPSGIIAFQHGTASPATHLVWLDAAGNTIETAAKPAEYRFMALSHDGRRLAVSIDGSRTEGSDVWVHDLTRGTATRLTFESSNDIVPIWSPDGERILFSTNRKSAGDVMVKRASGTGVEEMVIQTPHFTIATDWSRDGNTIAFQQIDTGSKNEWDLWLYSVPEKKSRLFLATPFAEQHGRISPDGKWLLYHSNESGTYEVYAQALDGSGGKWQISTDGGSVATWSADGRHVYYVAGDSQLIAVEITVTGDHLKPGAPRPLFRANFRGGPGMPYAPSADGTRFLAHLQPESEAVEPITLIQNWTGLLKK